MKKFAVCSLIFAVFACANLLRGIDIWPDGTEMDSWFLQTDEVRLDLPEVRVIDNGIYPDEGVLRTKEIQSLIDKTAKNGGGVITFTPGVFRAGAIFFKPGVHLKLEPGAVLLGSDDIADYPVREIRIEGQTCQYFSGLVNADGCDGFTIFGGGTIDGNGFRSWRNFWLRRKWNRQCTNKDEQRARLVYVSNSKNVRVDGVNLQNSMFWTAHFYRCDFLKVTNCRIYSLAKPDDVKGPSTDGIDLDVCSDVLVKGCWISNNDDGVCLKGGKGAFADNFKKFPGNGENHRVLVEDMTIVAGCHTALTLGSESVLCDNVVFRNSTVNGCGNLLNLKARTDTPQTYRNVLVENVNGKVRTSFLQCHPWAQFADFQGRTAEELCTHIENVTMRNCSVKCRTFIGASKNEAKYMSLRNFTFENLEIEAQDKSFHEDIFSKVEFTNVNVR
ncbi:MAG: right-handed parallel beta-helix repeat-containing protein [Kiritimatiellae bacterium]|nr:right-handed parallel beta-helix repeat-containing protein [Kiritimatiellia bacterium]